MTSAAYSFTFQQCLGVGGYGEIYLATAERPGEEPLQVAVKVLKLERVEDAEAVERFRDEARMLSALDHPHIVKVIHFTRLDGRVALVTELIKGCDLSVFCGRGRRMPERVAFELLADVANALDSALNTPSPETGRPLRLIHRDVKPSNIRVSDQGIVKLLDFGIARTAEMGRFAATKAGEIPCTPGFASPEALTGRELGPESDIFALGSTLYRVLSGEPFFLQPRLVDQRRVAIHRVAYNGYLDDRIADLGLSDPIEALVGRMLAHEPADRPTAREVEIELHRLAERVRGPTPGLWAGGTEFPPPRSVAGRLVGRTLVETPFEETTATPPPPPSNLRTVLPSAALFPPVVSTHSTVPVPHRTVAPRRPDPVEPPRAPDPEPPPPPRPARRRRDPYARLRLVMGGITLFLLGVLSALLLTLAFSR